ncbi:MAG: O-antigen ligase family protein [Oscillospiraceae bacterium]|nr:O-antigen ligase family protein [Oscillospiraceae bacterium]
MKHSVSDHVMCSVLEWVVLISPFLLGMFFPWGSAIVSIVLVFLLFYLLKNETLFVSGSSVFLTTAAIVLSHLGGTLWGTDRGMALIGAVQFLPLPLFVLLLEQYGADRRRSLLNKLPYAACVMVLLSLLLSRVGLPEGWFSVSGRQAGFFQYPNTYAAYLLFSVVLVLFGAPLRFGRLPWLAILIGGILLTGSRVVFVLLFGVLLIFLVKETNRKVRNGILGLAGLMLVISALYAALSGDRNGIGRFLTISASSSTFLGRLLYAQDALPVILKHPLGLGYTGYRWLQGSFQTGVYSVQHVHNEFLQLLLDVGWVPAGLFLWALWKSFHSEEGGFRRKMLLAVLLLHCLLDFDTQFVSMALLLFLVMDTEKKADRPIRRQSIAAGVLLGGALLSGWIGTASFCYYLRDTATAAKIYPAYTEAMTALLPTASEEEADGLADRVLRINKSVSIAYDVKARSAYYAGRFDEMLSCKQEAIRLSRYQLWEYLDYFDMLRLSYERFAQVGDMEKAEFCLVQLAEIPQMLSAVKEQTSSLGWKIQDQPTLELPAAYAAWLNTYMGGF